MAQLLSLATPITVPQPPSTTTYEVARLMLDRRPYARVLVLVQSNLGETISVDYSDERGGTIAAQLLSALNTANLSTKSLQQRVFEKLVADGKLPAGTVTGVPD